MKKVLWFGIAACAAAMMLTSPSSAWERRWIPPPMQFHPQFHPQFVPHFGGGPRFYGGGPVFGGGVIIQPPVMTCTSSHTGALLHYGLCDGSELACFGPDGSWLYDGPCVDSE